MVARYQTQKIRWRKERQAKETHKISSVPVLVHPLIIVSINVYFLLFVFLMYTSNNKAKWG